MGIQELKATAPLVKELLSLRRASASDMDKHENGKRDRRRKKKKKKGRRTAAITERKSRCSGNLCVFFLMICRGLWMVGLFCGNWLWEKNVSCWYVVCMALR